MSGTLRAEWRSTRKFRFPGKGRAWSFIERLACSELTDARDERGFRTFRHCHPVLYRPASLILDFIAWWRYHVTRTGPECGDLYCWEPEHWRDGKLGEIAAELDRQISDE
jgi:hypothetical protein